MYLSKFEKLFEKLLQAKFSILFQKIFEEWNWVINTTLNLEKRNGIWQFFMVEICIFNKIYAHVQISKKVITISFTCTNLLGFGQEKFCWRVEKIGFFIDCVGISNINFWQHYVYDIEIPISLYIFGGGAR